jgi:hypothetical protein
VLLWFCAKLEYVIRACTKQWLEVIRATPTPDNYTTLCEEFSQQNDELVERLYRLFVKAISYTTQSLIIYREKYALQPVLKPPAVFWDKGTDNEE